MSNRKSIWLIATGTGLLVAAWLTVALWPIEVEREAASPARRAHGGDGRIAAAARLVAEVKRPTAKTERKADKKPEIAVEREADDPDLTPEEEQQLDDIHEALNNEDLDAAIKLAEAAQKAKNPEIRMAMVETLGWLGARALPELTPFLGDPDEDVVFEATAQWQSALYEIEDDKEKCSIISMALKALTDEETLDEIASELNGMDELLSLGVIVDVLDNGTVAGKKAVKNAYETVTGEEWTDINAAEAWLEENYQPDEDDD